MSQEVHPKKMAIVRLITMICGQVLALVMMYEYGFFRFEKGGEYFYLNLAFGGVVLYCFVQMMMQIKILKKLPRTEV
jgi:hypothetical protein